MLVGSTMCSQLPLTRIQDQKQARPEEPALPPEELASDPGTSVAYVEGGRSYVDDITERDILCGRGGKSNHHQGNKKYRQVVGFMKCKYQNCPAKTQKTDLSRKIVEYCHSYGGRFVKKDGDNNRYYVLTKDEARKKTSQALRETKVLKWTS